MEFNKKIFDDLVSSFAKKLYLCAVLTKNAPVVELVDTLDLGSSAARRVSSSLIRRTIKETAGNPSNGLFFLYFSVNKAPSYH